MSAEQSDIQVEVSENIATISFRRPTKLNAIRAEDYDALAESLRAIDKRDDVLITVLQATGKFFCAGTDVGVPRKPDARTLTERRAFVDGVTRSNTDCSRALYSHSKILVAALNGPVMGIASAFLGHFDFIYCLPEVWLSVPFTFLGIVAEAGSSVSFVNRMGIAKANEVLLFGKKMSAQELLDCGFVNKIFPSQSVDSFHAAVRKQLIEQLEGLDPTALLKVKHLIQFGINEKNSKDGTNLRESYAQAERFATGIPAKRFTLIAEKKIKHKL
ncbi:ClpP/crotonase [Schizopora paradoxa]|uniref:ClpP/crotonase n=1 Tax=Schizopora paradoxa TaxID=27342 RepID=A0A0H2R831_9AGAM|nr:ClpP/crotonase [Schizopora paradoxa]